MYILTHIYIYCHPKKERGEEPLDKGGEPQDTGEERQDKREEPQD